MKVSVADAKNKLPELIRAAEKGERITICRRGKPVAELVRSAPNGQKKPKLGNHSRSQLVEAYDRRGSGRLPRRPLLVRVLLDTVTFVVAVKYPEKLSRRVREIVETAQKHP